VNVYFIGLLSALWLTSLAGLWIWRGNEVEQVVTSQWQARELKQAQDDAKTLAATESAYRAEETQHAADLASISANYQARLQDEQVKNDHVIADLRAGIVSLRYNAPAASASDCDHLSETPAGSGIGHETAIRRIPPKIAADLYGLAADADAIADQLRACQAIVTSDRMPAAVPSP